MNYLHHKQHEIRISWPERSKNLAIIFWGFAEYGYRTYLPYLAEGVLKANKPKLSTVQNCAFFAIK